MDPNPQKIFGSGKMIRIYIIRIQIATLHCKLPYSTVHDLIPIMNNQLNLAELTNNNLAGLEADSGERAHQVSRGG